MVYNGLVDIGVNLTHARFAADREQVRMAARAAGVEQMVLTGVSVEESRAAVALAETHPDTLAATAGGHPHHARDWSPEAAVTLGDLLDHTAVVAVGETGLDYNRDFSPRPLQRAAFSEQLALGSTHHRPAFLHQRDAEADFLAILREHRAALPGAVLHCFTGGRQLLERCLALDLYIGVTGWVCDERRGGELRDCIPAIPAERLLIETDAPFLLPRDLPEKPANRRNEPRFLPHILEAVARLRDVDPSVLAAQTAANSQRLFGR